MMAIVREPVETVDLISPSGSLATVDAQIAEQYLTSGWTPAAGYGEKSETPETAADKDKKTK